MTKTVVDCGNCGPDFHSIRQFMTSNFDAVVIQTHGADDTLKVMRSRHVDLVTVNRKLDRDYTDGIDVVKIIKLTTKSAIHPSCWSPTMKNTNRQPSLPAVFTVSENSPCVTPKLLNCSSPIWDHE